MRKVLLVSVLVLVCLLVTPALVYAQLFENFELFGGSVSVMAVAVALLLLFAVFQGKNNRANRAVLEELEKSHKKFRSLFDNMKEGFALHEIICDDDGVAVDYRFLDVNKAFEEITGLRREELLNRTVLEVLPETEDYWIKNYGRVALEGITVRFENYSQALGKYFAVTAFCPEKGRFAVMFFDITERIRLEQSLEAEKERLRITLMSVGDGVISTDREGFVELMNGVAEELTGWPLDKAKGRPVSEVFFILNEYTREVCADPVRIVLETGKIVGLANHTALISRDGTERSIADSAAPIVDKEGRVQGVVLVFRDVTEERLKRNEIEYLSYHDSLTGLYNRRFFEEELKRLDTERNLPLTIIVADVNGLKLINDAFGHLTGDVLLKKVAETLRRACREDDVIARWGGDEFVVILPKTDRESALSVIRRIEYFCREVEVESISLSVSLGHGTKEAPGQVMTDVLKTAEANMYKNKLYDSQSMIGRAIKVIYSTLMEKNKREARHSSRVAEISKRIARAMGLPEAQVNEIETCGLVHDIGKIAISEEILNKPGSLTPQEWSEIRRHPEVGYRILSTSNDMAEMAQYVLTHHERFDGKGYPSGIRGENIPLQARILAVADAYDAMTSERAYRDAIPAWIALEELRQNAGTQFDPVVVEVFVQHVFRETIK